MTEIIELDDCVLEVTVRRRGSLPRRLWRWATRRQPEWSLTLAQLSGPDLGPEWWAAARLRLARAVIDSGGRLRRGVIRP